MVPLHPYHVDYLFVGLGAANSLLLAQLHLNNNLNGKKIAVIEPHEKSQNDRTFCFWSTYDELRQLNLDHLVYKKWTNIKVSGTPAQNISPKNYYCIQSIDLYNQTKSILQNHSVIYLNEHWNGTPQLNKDGCEITVNNHVLTATYVFDSRPPKFQLPEKNQSQLYQSFFGWEVETATQTFDTSTAVLMDFDLSNTGLCEFMYVLPFAENRALIELTRFGKEKMTEAHANKILNEYTQKISASFKIVEKEKGVIPMSSTRIEKVDSIENWIQTGTAAGLLKPSTGYAFHAMAQDALQLAECIRNQKKFQRNPSNSRFKFYDRLLLKILEKTPEHGKTIFEQLFNRVPLKEVLRFLNEQTNLSNEIKIFSVLPKPVFIKAAINDFIARFTFSSPSLISLICCILFCLLNAFGFNLSVWAILGLGFFTIGLAHGSLDHLEALKNNPTQHLLLFIIRYLLLAVALAIGWYFFPNWALIFFILYSALHFGETDFEEWKLPSKLLSFLWGLTVLALILILHFQESVWVLKQIPHITITGTLDALSEQQQLIAKVLVASVAIIWPIVIRHKSMLYTALFLLLSSFLPLLISFGIYFVFQHSLEGWKHLKHGHQKPSNELWLQSLPFVIGATCIILGGLTIMQKNMWGIFFVILSCMSMPHVFSMNKFYLKFKAVR